MVEGYFDVIALSKAGYDIAVATCGTSLTASHIKILQRYSDHIHFLFDADPAGKEATRR
ncbi:toprim domain-containing protein [Patescibacteria group bacterium]|nr:toprim domain-containing protein [Patescibacteria group bacterium]